MRRWEKYKGTDIEYKMFLRQDFERLIEYIETCPDRCGVKLLKKCPRIKYEMLYLPGVNNQGVVEDKISEVS